MSRRGHTPRKTITVALHGTMDRGIFSYLSHRQSGIAQVLYTQISSRSEMLSALDSRRSYEVKSYTHHMLELRSHMLVQLAFLQVLRRCVVLTTSCPDRFCPSQSRSPTHYRRPGCIPEKSHPRPPGTPCPQRLDFVRPKVFTSYNLQLTVSRVAVAGNAFAEISEH